MSKVTLKQLEQNCQHLTRKYLPDHLQFLVEKRTSGYWLCILNFNTTGLSDISSKGVTKVELYYYIRMFESGLEFNK